MAHKFTYGKVDNPKIHDNLNIHYALKPLNFFFSFIGIQNYSYKSNKVSTKTALSKSYSLLLLFGLNVFFMYLMATQLSFYTETLSLSLIFFDDSAYFLSILTANLAISCPVFYTTGILVKYLENVESIDKHLCIPTGYYMKMRKWITVVTLLISSYISFVILFDLFATNSYLQTYYSTLYIALAIVDIFIFQYALHIWMVIFRMRALVSQLACSNKPLLHKTDCVDFSPNNLVYNSCWIKMNNLLTKCNVNYDFDATVPRLMIIYDKLADNVDIINSFYGLQVMLISQI